jgi:hypothetical protein
MKINLHEGKIKESGETRMGKTTLAQLFAAIQDEVSLSEDDVVVVVIAHLFHTGRMKYATR